MTLLLSCRTSTVVYFTALYPCFLSLFSRQWMAEMLWCDRERPGQWGYQQDKRLKDNKCECLCQSAKRKMGEDERCQRTTQKWTLDICFFSTAAMTYSCGAGRVGPHFRTWRARHLQPELLLTSKDKWCFLYNAVDNLLSFLSYKHPPPKIKT